MSNFARLLLEYYDKSKRSLPWREDPIPYQVWVSEIMLQQTRVEVVKERYLSFLRAFPDIPSLAKASEEEVLKEWEGLGYYSRAKNLRKGAQTLLREHNAQLPKTKVELLKIPGIGEYTSSSISSIAFNQPEVALDGNLFRIFSRVNFIRKSYENGEAKKEAIVFFKKEMPSARCGDFNEGLMELGETLCLPKGKPLCEFCPFRFLCKAHLNGQETAMPLPKSKKERERVSINVYLILWKDMVLLRKREGKGLLSGTHEFPNFPRSALCETAFETNEIKGRTLSLGHGKHVFSHLEWDMDWYEIECEEEPSLKGCFLVPLADLKTVYVLSNAFTNFCKNHAILGF